jgi:hypothetical protein
MSIIRPMCARCTRRFTVSSSRLVPGTHGLVAVCRSLALCPLVPTRLYSSSTPAGSPFLCLSTSMTSSLRPLCSAADDHLLHQIGASFPVKDLSPFRYFLGIEAAPNSRGIGLTQKKYVLDLLHGTEMVKGKPTPICTHEKLSTDVGHLPGNKDAFRYRSMVGGLQYLTLTRPNILFAINKVCQFLSRPTEVH